MQPFAVQPFAVQPYGKDAAVADNTQHFKLEVAGDVYVIHLNDPKLFEIVTVSELQDQLLKLVDEQSPNKVVVDFTDVAHCSTAVVNGLLRVKKRVVKAGGQLKLSGMSETIREAYRLLNLDGTVFHIYPTRDDAVAAF